MTKPQVVLHTLPNSGGSGTGASHYLTAVECSRKAQLKARMRAAGDEEENSVYAVGTIFHELKRIQNTQFTDDIVIQLDDVNLEPAVVEAQRLFTAYNARFPRNEWSLILAAEQVMEVSNEEIVGVSPFTIKADAVCKIDASALKSLCNSRPQLGEQLTAGVYIWDYKTVSASSQYDAVNYRFSLQNISYQAVWNALHPDMPCNGMIFDIIVRHKILTEKSFYQIYCPPITETDKIGMKRFLQYAKPFTEMDIPNWGACKSTFNKPCEFLLNGMCNRL